MTQKERDTHGFFQQAETNIYEIPYVYLASPFSHPDPEVRIARVAAIAKITARLIAEGHIVFSPVAYTAEIQKMAIRLRVGIISRSGSWRHALTF